MFSKCYLTATILVTAGTLARAGNAPAPGDYVTREDYEKLRRQMLDMKTELDALKQDRAGTDARFGKNQAEVDETIADIRKQLADTQDAVDNLHPGSSSFLLTGDAQIGFQHLRGSPSSFGATYSPLILYQPTDRLLFEAALDFSVGTDSAGVSSTDVNLNIADISYIVNDWVAVGGGLFVVPFGVYHNHFDPPWINKLPDDPLAFSDGGIAPSSQLGAFALGGLPIGPSRLTYDVYVSNGPRLITNARDAAGSLDFTNFNDNNDGKAFGGRIGFLPVPEVEVGYSVQWAQTAERSFRNVDALLQAVDVEYRNELRPIDGVIDFRAEYIYAAVSRATYDASGKLGFGPINFPNNRNGGYAQIAYRPTLVGNPWIRSVELALRYDWLFIPRAAPGGDFEQRWTFGIDYWLQPNAVFKIAYELDRKTSGDDASGFLVQFGIGL